MNIYNKILFIAKFLFIKDNGFLRKTYVFPLLTSFIGSYIIFMIFSIMNSVSFQITDRIDSFHYKYYYDESDIHYLIDSTKIVKGNSRIAYLTDDNSDNILNYYELSDINFYAHNKLNKYLKTDKKYFDKSDIFIGDELANDLNVEIGDSLYLYYPSEVNLSTLYVPHDLKIISGIFNIDLIDYDQNTVIGNLNETKNSKYKFNYYFDNLDSNDSNYNNNIILSNMILDGLNLEKKIYYFFGFMVILISCFMLFQINIQFIKEKINQLSLLNAMGFNNKKMSAVLLVSNNFLVTVMSILGLFITNVSTYLFLEHGLLRFVYDALPYKIMYISYFNSEILIILLLINIVTLIATMIPVYLTKKNNYVKF